MPGALRAPGIKLPLQTNQGVIMNTIETSTQQDEHPVHRIGNPIRTASGDVFVTATLTGDQSMLFAMGWHIILSTEPRMTWEEGERISMYGETLALEWRKMEAEALKAIFPRLANKEGALTELSSRTSSDSLRTAPKESFVCAHVFVTQYQFWEAGLVRSMSDDAGSPHIQEIGSRMKAKDNRTKPYTTEEVVDTGFRHMGDGCP